MKKEDTAASLSPRSKRPRSPLSEQEPSLEPELSEEEKAALEEVEAEIAQLISTGIQDVSIMDNENNCAAVWEHIKSLYSDGTTEGNDEFGVDVRLKDVVRAYAEGSTVKLSLLIPKLRCKISAHCKEICEGLSDARFSTLIPVFVARKNLGEPFHKQSVAERVESSIEACLWVWESPSMDVFPVPLKEVMNSARESRGLISKRYKALLKVKEAIKCGDAAARAAANEQLGIIYKKVLLEREKRERMETKQMATKKSKQPISAIFAKSAHVKEPKSTKDASPTKQTKASSKQSTATGGGTRSLLLTWLKPASSSNSTSSMNKTGVNNLSEKAERPFLTKVEEKTTDNPITGDENAMDSPALKPEFLDATESQMTLLSDYIAKLPQNTKHISTVDVLNNKMLVIKEKHDGNFEEFNQLCSNHRESWMRYFTYVNKNRRFFVETSVSTENGNREMSSPTREKQSKSFLVDDIGINIVDTTYGDPCLGEDRFSRVFHMSDNDWKRPSMRVLVSRRSHHIKPVDPAAIELAMDYFAESDEEWFERYDVDDVDDSGSEEEEEEEEEADWIVQDNPDQGIQKHTQNLCEVVKVYCVNKNWHWIVDGIPQNNEECFSVEEAKKNGMNITTGVYGFGYEGYSTNPITEFLSGMRGHRVIMTTEDVQDFLKYCHAKHSRKEDLIAEFKEMKPFCSTSDIKEKFRKYICRMKVDSTRQRWLVTTEAALLFGIRDELDAILGKELDEVGE